MKIDPTSITAFAKMDDTKTRSNEVHHRTELLVRRLLEGPKADLVAEVVAVRRYPCSVIRRPTFLCGPCRHSCAGRLKL